MSAWTDNRPAPVPLRRHLLPLLEEATVVSPTDDELQEQGVIALDSRDLRSRPFNLLRTSLLRRFEKRQIKTLGVVSPCPGAGKSFVATNLAAALARVPDMEVCLFDTDLRGASVAKIFGIELEGGLERYLAGEVEHLSGLAYRLKDQRLLIFPSRPPSASSAELLATKSCAALVEAAATRPGISIFDLPPAFANDDAAILAAKLDGYLLVIEDGRTTKKQVQDALQVLPAGKCVGTILNRYKGGIFAEDYGYGYGQQDAYSGYFD